MELVHARCCGLDVHNATLVACFRQGPGEGTKEVKRFGSTTRELRDLLQWLVERDCPIVAMESTGVYWRPVYNVLSSSLEVVVGNARAMKRPVDGQKGDDRDSRWISDLLAFGLIKPSFIPGRTLMSLRETTRVRIRLVEKRSQTKNRIQGVLQTANIKLSTVASDVFGKSGRKMIEALVAGERDPAKLAQMALSKLRGKIPQLELALEGSFTEHHAKLIEILLRQHDETQQHIAELDQHISAIIEELHMQPQVDLLCTIPGVDRLSAHQILSEIGTDMSRWGSDKRLAEWATVCPGNNESAGKRRSGRTRKGNRYLKRTLVECANATERSRTALGASLRRFRARLGAKKAAVAVAHRIIVIIFHMLSEGSVYDDRRLASDGKEDERRRKRAVRDLERLGYKVTIEKAA